MLIRSKTLFISEPVSMKWIFPFLEFWSINVNSLNLTKGRCLQRLDCIVVGKSCCAPSGQDVSHAGLDLKAPTLYSMSCQVVSLLDCIRGTFIPGNGTMVRTVFSHVVSVPCVFSVSRSCQSPVEKDSVFGLFSNEAKCVSCSAILN